MLGFLRAIEVLQKQKNDVMKQMKKVSSTEKESLQIVLDELNEAINYLHLKINEFLIYMKNTDRKTYKVIMKHYFENMPWNYAYAYRCLYRCANTFKIPQHYKFMG